MQLNTKKYDYPSIDVPLMYFLVQPIKGNIDFISTIFFVCRLF